MKPTRIILFAGLVVLATISLTSCSKIQHTPEAPPPDKPAPPTLTITSFQTTNTETVVGNATTFEWEAVSSEPSGLSCWLDPGDGSAEYTFDCNASDTFSHTYNAPGTYQSTLRVAAGELTASETVRVEVLPLPINVVEVQIPNGNVVAFIGHTYQLKAHIVTENNEPDTATWVSSDPKVATVQSDGTITAHALGSITITAKSNADPSKTATTHIHVVDPMVLEVDIDAVNTDFVLGMGRLEVGPYVIDWDDGTITRGVMPGRPHHIWDEPGNYTIKIGAVSAEYLTLHSIGNDHNFTIVAVHSWGNLPLTHLLWGFLGATGLHTVPDTLPSSVEALTGLFKGATTFNGDISGWDTSNVEFMDELFHGATSFNQDLSGWCVEKIPAEPRGFATGATNFSPSHHPNWGAPCTP